MPWTASKRRVGQATILVTLSARLIRPGAARHDVPAAASLKLEFQADMTKAPKSYRLVVEVVYRAGERT